MKTLCHVSFAILSLDNPSDCRYFGYLRYIDSKIDKTRLFHLFSINFKRALLTLYRYSDMSKFM